MPEQLELSDERFAVWARRNQIALPYPLDVTAVPVRDDEPVRLTDPLLDRFARITRAPRVSAFALRTVPSGVTSTAVAIAGADDAVFVLHAAGRVQLQRVRDTELAASVVAALPERVGVAVAPIELSEPDWTELLAALARSEPPRQLRARLDGAGVGPRLAELLLANPPGSVPVGTLAAMAWAGEGVLGPSLASWYEYETGAVLARLRRSRRSGRAVVQVGPYSREDALRALVDAVTSALERRRT